MPWQAAVVTALDEIAVEGSVNERAELAGTFVRARGESAILASPTRRALRVSAGSYGPHARARRSRGWAPRRTRGPWCCRTPPTGPAAEAVVETRTLAFRAMRIEYRDGVAAIMGLGDPRQNQRRPRRS